MDARQAVIESKIRQYFAAVADHDYARAQQVCCTAAWRAQYPVEEWQHNFDGVSQLHLVRAPRYLHLGDDSVVVDTDYAFESGGAQRKFTLRWTFKPVGGDWQADLAEAYPTP
jgi:hypothetical protein